ncbi:MAG: nuclear transport factor 2 family protein [Steroidobacteraceae bacterium]
MRQVWIGVATLAAVSVVAYAAGSGKADRAAPGADHTADRVEIQDLQARYMFALDWQDADAYAATFAEDGVLDWAGGIVPGREAIRKEVHGMRAYFAKHEQADAPTRPARLRHFISNVVVDFDGDRATGRAYWFEINDDNRSRLPYVGGYGHYEDELRRVDGHWLFTRRKIYNEMLPDRTARAVDPVVEMRK